MTTFTYQNWKRKESEQRIINELGDGNKSYGELLKLTDLSKPILSERLKGLEEQGKVTSVAESKTKRFLYHLQHEKLDKSEKGRIILHELSKIILRHLGVSVNDKTISDKKYFTMARDSLGTLIQFKMYDAFLAPFPEVEEWFRSFLGPEFAKMLPTLLLPQNRDHSILFEQVLSKEDTLLVSEDREENATRLLKSLNELWGKITGHGREAAKKTKPSRREAKGKK
jgi:DNA-binding HxlR family transcriptional regulator